MIGVQYRILFLCAYRLLLRGRSCLILLCLYVMSVHLRRIRLRRVLKRIVYDALQVSQCSLTRATGRAAQDAGQARQKRSKRGGLSLIWCETVIIDEIAAHPPDFTEFFSLISIESLEGRRVDERIVVAHVVFVRGVWMQRSAVGQGFEYRIH